MITKLVKWAIVLSEALTLRVSAFVLLSPLAGAVSNQFDLKHIMVTAHILQMLKATGRTFTLKVKFSDYQQITRSLTLPTLIRDISEIIVDSFHESQRQRSKVI